MGVVREVLGWLELAQQDCRKATHKFSWTMGLTGTTATSI